MYLCFFDIKLQKNHIIIPKIVKKKSLKQFYIFCDKNIYITE